MKKIFLLIFLISTTLSTYATHMMGGEITYTCSGNNNYQIKLTLYVDCLTGEQTAIDADNPAYIAIYENAPISQFKTSIQAFQSTTRIVPLEFSNECISTLPSLCMRETIFYYNINLAPSPYGYTIVYQRCCRNFSIANISAPGNKGVTYYATIPPNTEFNCIDNSPVFNNQPPQIICNNNPFIYDFSATDTDGDSLVYSLCATYGGGSPDAPKPNGTAITGPPFPSIPYNFGYTPSDPLPSLPPLTIDPNTGIMSASPNALGRYQVAVCVDQYRDGQYFGGIYRDLQFYVTNCSKNVIAKTPLYSSEPNTYIINCDNYKVDFKNTSTGGFNYEWDFGDGSPISTEFEPSHTYADTGTYIITLFVNKGSTCSDSIKRIVKVYPKFNVRFSSVGNLCPGDTISFNHTADNTTNYPYSLLWNFGDGDTSTSLNPQHVYSAGRDYEVSLIATSSLGCVSRYDSILPILDFKPSAGNDTMIVLGYEYYLNGSGGDIYSWSPNQYLSDAAIANPKVNFPDTGAYTYSVIITAEEGCIGYDTVNIIVVKDPAILMPNAFSPNGDGLNDVFKPKIVGYPFINFFHVFNRWGERVFVSYKAHEGWDGTYGKNKLADQGVYFWEISVRKVDGTNEILKGDVTLIR